MHLSDLLSGEEQIRGTWPDTRIDFLTADSREAGPGGLFAALHGTKVDGAQFIPRAIAAGAAAILAGTDARLPDISDVPLVVSADPRRSLARMAARLFAPQPSHMVAITGTNGKTSVAEFVCQIWAALGLKSASIGTLGVVCRDGRGVVDPPAGLPEVKLTSPDPVVLHGVLRGLGAGQYDHVAIEASSHGLEQRRVDGVRLDGWAFTNITRDHLDFHSDFDAYLAAKLRLFTILLHPGALAVVNCDGAGHHHAVAAARAANLRVLTHGRTQGDLRLLAVTTRAQGLDVSIGFEGKSFQVALDLVGAFQAENVATALCLATSAGLSIVDGIAVLSGLRGVKGRLEPVGKTASGGAVYVDFSHTPDALKTALIALRPHVGGRIVTVFGAGGDRDPGKRRLMGEAVAAHGDLAIVTDDNPRSEVPAAIRAQVLLGCPGAIEVGDRAEAIAAGLEMLGSGDALLVAGKGHETGQEIAGVLHPFSDHDEIAKLLDDGGRA